MQIQSKERANKMNKTCKDCAFRVERCCRLGKGTCVDFCFNSYKGAPKDGTEDKDYYRPACEKYEECI